MQNDIGKRRRRIAINPDRFDKLITALRTAVDNDGVLDKDSTDGGYFNNKMIELLRCIIKGTGLSLTEKLKLLYVLSMCRKI